MTVTKSPAWCRHEGCTALATTLVHGSGHPTLPATGKVPYCDAHWTEAYENVLGYPTHGWIAVEQTADTLF